MDCLDENAVSTLFERRMPDAELAAVDEHVSGCGRCRALLATYAEAFTALPSTVTATPYEKELPPGHSIVQQLIAERSARRRIGTTLRGKWTLDALLGVGGMGYVFAASHRNAKRVAIKILKPEWAAQPELVRRFLREGYVANKVGHPGAVSILDDDLADDGAPFLVMELLEGEGLGHRLARGLAGAAPLSIREVLVIGGQVLEVLAQAHAAGVVHRDLKPDNLFLTKDGETKILDFGTARLKEVSADRSDTQTGVLMGTPSFMPPEQARGQWDEVDGRSDLWALGATMYTLLTGRNVRSSKTRNNDLYRAMTEPVPSVLLLRPDLPPACAELIDRALAFDAKDRWPDAGAMGVAVRNAIEEEAKGADTAPSRQYRSASRVADPAPRRSAARRWPLAGVFVVAVVGLGAAAHRFAASGARTPEGAGARTEPSDRAGSSATTSASGTGVAASSLAQGPVEAADAGAKTAPRPPPHRAEPSGRAPALGSAMAGPPASTSQAPASAPSASADYLDRRY